jgi:hypothetical protein
MCGFSKKGPKKAIISPFFAQLSELWELGSNFGQKIAKKRKKSVFFSFSCFFYF